MLPRLKMALREISTFAETGNTPLFCAEREQPVGCSFLVLWRIRKCFPFVRTGK